MTPQSIERQARALVAAATQAGLEILIEQRPLKPLAMGNHEPHIIVRPAHKKVEGASCEAELSSEEAAAFWRSVYPDGMTAEQVRDELTDYHFLLEQVPKVYHAVTGGKLSKANYFAATVIAEFEDHINETVDEALKEAAEEADGATLWCIHIPGPDDLHAAPSKAEAERMAEAHNTAIRSHVERLMANATAAETAAMPTLESCLAVVKEWPHDAVAHEQALATWNPDTWKSPQQPAATEAAEVAQ